MDNKKTIVFDSAHISIIERLSEKYSKQESVDIFFNILDTVTPETKLNWMKNKDIIKENEKMTESVSFRNFLAFPFWLVLQIIKKPIGEACFILTSETSWRVGILWSLIKK